MTVTVHLEHILDLTNAKIRAALGTSVDELTGSWQMQLALGSEVPTHTLASAAINSGKFQGILFPSALSPKHSNLMVWTDKVSAPSFVEVYDPSGVLKERISHDARRISRR